MNILILFLPLISGFSILTFGRYLGKKGSIIISFFSIFISVLISFKLFFYYLNHNTIEIVLLGEWFDLGIIKTKFEFIFDKESIIMINLISIISFIVITYSYWYMDNDAHFTRFISYLLIFSVTMFILVTSYNFLLLFAGWETVGIMSFLLINFWFNSFNSNKSAFKAILYNKIGDIGYILSLIILINIYKNTNIQNIFISTNENISLFLNLLVFFFILAAIAKSAQIFLHCWLGDAMAGPTPVSALLHAATMVTAGVFLLVRVHNNYFSDYSILNNYFILFIGALTILFGGFSSFGQFDIKKLIAFSTCSQIGYMFINNGFFNSFNTNTGFFISGLADSSLFHLFTHGFFKALLFLCAGILIHNFNNDQDIRKYGSLVFKFPITYIFILIGSLSIISFPFLSGFYSKENIIYNSFLSFNPLFLSIFLIFGAFLTNLYSFKLLFYSFFNPINSNKSLFYSSYSEIPYIYLPFFFILLIGSTFFGFFFKDFFIGLGIHPFGLDYELFPGHHIIHFVPLFIILFVLLVNILFFNFHFFLSFFVSLFVPFFSFLNRRAFFDPIFNYLFAYSTLLTSYSTFKFIDRGFLEFFGPLGLFRFFFSFFSSFNLNNQFISNISFLFFYFFISVFSIFSLLFFF